LRRGPYWRESNSFHFAAATLFPAKSFVYDAGGFPTPRKSQLRAAAIRNHEENMIQTGRLMDGKRGLVMGVANDRSIAWGIAKQAADHGAELAFTFQSDALGKRVRPLAASVGSDLVLECDVTDGDSMDGVFGALEECWGGLDFVIHAIAYSDKEELKGRYIDTSAENFAMSMNISCYSFTAICKRAEPLMKNGGSLLTLTYLGGERVVPHYNVMGVAKAALDASVRYLAVDLGRQNIRVNAISAGPIKTLAASGIGDFRYILKWNELNAPLKRNTTIEEVGGAGLYLLSDLSSGVTGEVHHVDCGYHVVGMKAVDAPDISTVND
jgi:enoyl-[acyl-carrier protein] reductase I